MKSNRVLLILPYNKLYPCKNGGMQRFVNLMNQLSICSDLIILSFADFQEFIKVQEEFPNLKNAEFLTLSNKVDYPFFISLLPRRFATALYGRILTNRLFSKSNGVLLSFYRRTLKILKTNDFDYIIYENLASLDLAELIKKKHPNIKQVYDAHNFDTEIAKFELSKKLINRAAFSAIEMAESKLHEYIDILWVCSRREASLFSVANSGQIKQIDVIPNGTLISEIKPKIHEKSKPKIIFVGSLNYQPNNEGLIWFLENVLPLIKCVFDFDIIGSGEISSLLRILISKYSYVNLVGYVEDLEPYYNSTQIVVVPILSGSGTRLKAIEAMNYSCAIVSTSKGIEGIDTSDVLIVEDDPVKMAEAIQRLMGNPELIVEMGRKSRELAEKMFDWNVIGKLIYSSLNKR